MTKRKLDEILPKELEGGFAPRGISYILTFYGEEYLKECPFEVTSYSNDAKLFTCKIEANTLAEEKGFDVRPVKGKCDYVGCSDKGKHEYWGYQGIEGNETMYMMCDKHYGELTKNND